MELRQTAVWFLGIYLAVFCIAGLFIYLMMKRTVQQMEKLQEVAGKQEMLMGALAHEMKTPLTSIIGYSDTLRHVKLNDEQKDRALEHISREGKRFPENGACLTVHQKNSQKKTALWKRTLFSLKEWPMAYLLIIYGILICHTMNYLVLG